MATDIVLTTINAKYIHASFGLRYLLANLGELEPRTRLLEFTSEWQINDMAERILQEEPRIVGIGVYIWNERASTELVSHLKKVRPELAIVLGGPEISYEFADREIFRLADHLIPGEGDLAFAKLCRTLLTGGEAPKVIPREIPPLEHVRLPYTRYTHEDLAHRLIYVEASRGCPFTCEFCLSSLDEKVRAFDLDQFLTEMQGLLDRGARRFKFVDRTFNLKLPNCLRIMDFFLRYARDGLELHFEIVPDRLPAELLTKASEFPEGTLQFEVGIQTFNPVVAQRISRRQDYDRTLENLRALQAKTRVHVHADLIIGLPGEDLESFGQGFDRLLAAGPHEIQVGILKRLRGTPISRHDSEWAVRYSAAAPYEILQNQLIPFSEMQRLKRFARYWELHYNRGTYRNTLPLLWAEGSPFQCFLSYSDWIYSRSQATYRISQDRLTGLLHRYLIEELKISWEKVTEFVKADLPRFRPSGNNLTTT